MKSAMIPRFGDLPIFISQQLPMRSTQMGPMKLSPFVDVTDEFRVEIDAWLRDFFGDTHYPQPCLIHSVRGYGMVFVSPQAYIEIRRAVPAMAP